MKAPLNLEFRWEHKAFLEWPVSDTDPLTRPGQLRVPRSASLSFITDFLLPATVFSNLQLKNSRRRKIRGCS